jgi:hypothetical protein
MLGYVAARTERLPLFTATTLITTIDPVRRLRSGIQESGCATGEVLWRAETLDAQLLVRAPACASEVADGGEHGGRRGRTATSLGGHRLARQHGDTDGRADPGKVTVSTGMVAVVREPL